MKHINITNNLKKLEELVQWFENREEIDVEAALDKVKEGTQLIKESRGRLREIENEFEEVKKEMEKNQTTE